MRALSLFVVLLLAAVATAESFDGYTRLLVPVTANNLRGANGSVWTTEWTAYNGTPGDVYVSGPFPYLSLSPVFQDNVVKKGETKRLFLSDAIPGMDGAFVFVPTNTLEDLAMSLRVRDISVRAQSYGTSIPVVRNDAFRSFVRLIDIPTDPAYRITLRIYSAAEQPQTVRVSVFAASGTMPLESYDVLLRENASSGISEPVERPAYAQLDPLSSTVRAAAGGRIRIEIWNLSEIVSPPPPSIWAFASISHNETQQVTTVLP